MTIIPGRVREARTERGLSLADLAGTEVSRAFIHQVEQGLARPSVPILEMIARRTGKPVDFFIPGTNALASPLSDLANDLVAMSKRLERLANTLNLSEANREAFRIVVTNLRHGARLIIAVRREGESARNEPEVHPQP